jgi:hypothetical protein
MVAVRKVLIWKYRASSPAPDSDAISPLASLGANPCPATAGLGKPTVATVPPNLAVRLAAMDSGLDVFHSSFCLLHLQF